MLDFLSHQSTTRDKKFGKENIRNSVKEIFNRGGSSTTTTTTTKT